MGLFKDFKDDITQAAKEMLPGSDNEAGNVSEEPAVNAQAEAATVEATQPKEPAITIVTDTKEAAPAETQNAAPVKDANAQFGQIDVKTELSKLDGLLDAVKEEPAPVRVNTPATVKKEERRTMSENANMVNETVSQAVEKRTISDETSIITSSTVLSGDVQTSGSFDIQGTVNGNVSCYGKIVVTGVINGNSSSSEFFADEARIQGEVVSSGTVKVGAGSVIIGNITASSAVIAGAVKGDIDVQGPVVVDTSAVIMGNIKSRSVQINNGAVIEGFCSQCYADVDVQGMFEN